MEITAGGIELTRTGDGPGFRMTPCGPFDLAQQNRYFGGWPTLAADPATIVMAFPVDGAWDTSVAVTVHQDPSGAVSGQVHGSADADVVERAARQALATLSLDVDGRAWPQVGERDPVIGALQRAHGWIRPVLFHSAYEAAASFLLGHRLRIAQTRQLRRDMATRHGRAIEVRSEVFHAFPGPAVLAELSGFPGVAAEKVARLHALAAATLQGRFDRSRLNALLVDEALEEARTLPGVGPFFAQGIVTRGAGRADEITDDDITRYAVGERYHPNGPVDRDVVLAVADVWRPYRMWAIVLLHVEARGSGRVPRRR